MTEISDAGDLREIVAGGLDADSIDNFDYLLVRLALPAVQAVIRINRQGAAVRG